MGPVSSVNTATHQRRATDRRRRRRRVFYTCAGRKLNGRRSLPQFNLGAILAVINVHGRLRRRRLLHFRVWQPVSATNYALVIIIIIRVSSSARKCRRIRQMEKKKNKKEKKITVPNAFRQETNMRSKDANRMVFDEYGMKILSRLRPSVLSVQKKRDNYFTVSQNFFTKKKKIVHLLNNFVH